MTTLFGTVLGAARPRIAATAAATLLATLAPASADRTALVLFETNPEAGERREGLAFLEIDPASPNYGRILSETPFPPETVSHHIFYSPDRTKAYVTSLGTQTLRVLDVTKTPYASRIVDVPGCDVGEDVAFAPQAGRWYLTCMGSSNLIVGNIETDAVIDTIDLPAPYPHGVAVNEAIDRMLVTSTVDPTDLSKAGEHIVVLRASTGEVLSTHEVSSKASPSGSAPVESFFVPGSEPPVAYITNMLEHSLWLAEWRPDEEAFGFREVFDFAPLGQAMPLEVYFDADASRAYVTTANPGHLNAFDIADPGAPKHLGAAATAGGAHHMVFSADGAQGFVQNGLLNLPGMNGGSITVVDLETMQPVGSLDVFKDAGRSVNMIELTAQDGGGHAH